MSEPIDLGILVKLGYLGDITAFMKSRDTGKHSLQHRLMIGLGVMLLPLVVLGGGALFSLERAISAFEKTDNTTLEELFPVKNLESLINKASGAVNACFLDHVPAACDRLMQYNQQIESQYAALLSAPSDLSEKQALIHNSHKAWRQLQQQIQSVTPDGAKGSDIHLNRQKQENLNTYSQQAIEILDRIQALLIHYQTADNLTLAREVKQNVRVIISTMFALGLGVAGVAGWLLARSILKPLSILQAGVNSLGEGQLSHRIQLSSQDELGQLAVRFNQMAKTLEENQMELINLATRDGLTGAYNRREFTKRLKAELERSQRYQHFCSLIMFDIDFFKKLNDTHGHQAGDEALKSVAALLKREVRPSDQVARYGGEEFAVILPQTNTDEAVLVAERLRQMLIVQDIAIAANQTIRVTASLGVATFPDDAQNDESLLGSADQALYAAKHGGRNRVMSFKGLA